MFEPLEFRRLMSVQVEVGAVVNQVVVPSVQRDVSGTAKNDVILVSPGASASTVRVSVNGQVTFAATDQPITLRGNAGNDKVHLDLGDAAAALQFVIYGGAGDDTITGSIAAERIIAGDGNDFVNGMGGRDTIYGEGGDDSVRGGGSSDLLDGGADNDTVRGDAGNDRLLGGDGFDRLRGSAGNDSCEGGASKDFIGGELGDDELSGDGGDDVLAGGEGNDLLYGGAGDDNCDGNDGDDLLAGGSGSNDQLFGHGGNDGFSPGDDAAECMDIKDEDLEPGTTALTAGNTYGLTKTGSGTLVLTGSNTYSGSSAVNAGSLTVANGGTLDLANNNLVIAGGTVSGSGLITGNGSSLLAGGLTTIGVATGSQVAGLGSTDTLFAGQTVSGGSTIVMYTYGGDANLDGKVDADDYAAIDLNVGMPGTSGWYNGDFNYDGIISADDYAIIDFNIINQGTPFPTSP